MLRPSSDSMSSQSLMISRARFAKNATTEANRTISVFALETEAAPNTITAPTINDIAMFPIKPISFVLGPES